MVELPTNPFDLGAINDLATSQGFEYWIGLGINLILSTIIGGIILIILLQVFGKVFKETPTRLANAFLLVLIINIITFVGLLGIGIPYVSQIGIAAIALQVLIWIALIKLFFGEFSILHAVIVGIVGYFATTYATSLVIGLFGGVVPI